MGGKGGIQNMITTATFLGFIIAYLIGFIINGIFSIIKNIR